MILVSTVYACELSDHCLRGTAVQHGDSDPLLVPPHSEVAFLPVNPSASAGDLQEAKNRNHSADLRDSEPPLLNIFV